MDLRGGGRYPENGVRARRHGPQKFPGGFAKNRSGFGDEGKREKVDETGRRKKREKGEGGHAQETS